MNALKKYRISQIVTAVVFIALAVITVILGLEHSFDDFQSILWVALAGVFVLLIGVNLLVYLRSRIGSVLMSGCDVVGYEVLFDRLVNKRKAATDERAFDRFCIAFYKGDFQKALEIFPNCNRKYLLMEPEIFAYLAYIALVIGNRQLIAYAESGVQDCVCYSKKKVSVFDQSVKGAIRYAQAMAEERYADALVVFPPRKYKKGDRYFSIFAQYCFACAEEKCGHALVAEELFKGIAANKGNLWFIEQARLKVGGIQQTVLRRVKRERD